MEVFLRVPQRPWFQSWKAEELWKRQHKLSFRARKFSKGSSGVYLLKNAKLHSNPSRNSLYYGGNLHKESRIFGIAFDLDKGLEYSRNHPQRQRDYAAQYQILARRLKAFENQENCAPNLHQSPRKITRVKFPFFSARKEEYLKTDQPKWINFSDNQYKCISSIQIEKCDKFTYSLIRYLEDRFGKTITDLQIDIILTHTGKIWLIGADHVYFADSDGTA